MADSYKPASTVVHGTTAQWATRDGESRPLGDGLLGFDTDTGELKVGDGSTLWASLDLVKAAPMSGADIAAALDAYFGNSDWQYPTGSQLLNATSATSVTLPVWDDSTGTLFVDNGTDKRAVGWSSTGFAVYENGSLLEQYPPAWSNPPQDTPGTTYYVDATGGSDAAAGTSEGTAWQTIAKVNATTLSAGDTVLLKRGETWKEILQPTDSGAADNYIKFGNYGEGNRPVIDGSTTTTRHHTIKVDQESYIWFDGIDSYGANSTGAGSAYYGSVLVIGNTSTTDVDHIYFTDCIFRESETVAVGVWNKAEYIYFKSCQFLDNTNIGAINTGSPLPDRIKEFYLIDCEFDGNESAGFRPWSGSIYNCDFHDSNLDSLIYFDRQLVDSTLRIHDNRFYNGNGSSNGIQVKSSAHVYRNYVWNLTNGNGISHLQPQGEDAVFYDHHNVIYPEDPDTSVAGILFGRTEDVGIPGGTLTGYIWNNTFAGLSYSGSNGGIYTESAAGNNLIASIHLPATVNNIFADSSRAVKINSGPLGTQVFDYNLYDTSNPNIAYYNGANRDWATWQTAVGEANGTIGLPGFVDGDTATLANRDYSLTATSDALSAGTANVPLVATDVNSWIGINYVPHGTSPDCGAYQRLSGKGLDFSNRLLGLTFAADTVSNIELYATRKTNSELAALTA